MANLILDSARQNRKVLIGFDCAGLHGHSRFAHVCSSWGRVVDQDLIESIEQRFGRTYGKVQLSYDLPTDSVDLFLEHCCQQALINGTNVTDEEIAIAACIAIGPDKLAAASEHFDDDTKAKYRSVLDKVHDPEVRKLANDWSEKSAQMGYDPYRPIAKKKRRCSVALDTPEEPPEAVVDFEEAQPIPEAVMNSVKERLADVIDKRVVSYVERKKIHADIIAISASYWDTDAKQVKMRIRGSHEVFHRPGARSFTDVREHHGTRATSGRDILERNVPILFDMMRPS